MGFQSQKSDSYYTIPFISNLSF